MRNIVLLIVVAAAALSTAACNTVAGAGKDVSATGHAVTDTANDAKPH
jgi:predicted small secreted protein